MFVLRPAPGLELRKTFAQSFATWALGKYQVDKLLKWEVKQIKQLLGMHENFLNASAFSENRDELKCISAST